jgi:adenine phosphoribosyltransferase
VQSAERRAQSVGRKMAPISGFRCTPGAVRCALCAMRRIGGFMDLAKIIRDVPDFPQKGIIFKDITTLLKNPEALKYVIDTMVEKYRHQGIDKIVGIESRGFIFGGAVAYMLGCGFVPARKPGKLPAETISESYTLEYGTNTLEIHTDAIAEGENVLIVDDLLATGGTAAAVAKMVERLKGKVAAIEFLIELEFLKGIDKLKEYTVHSYIKY